MKQLSRNLTIVISAICAAVIYSGCKEDTIIKSNLTPTVNNINTDTIPDTITILSKTVFDDSVVTSLTPSNQLVIHALGTANDPYFGRTNAGIYLQVVPERSNYSFSANSPVIDSAFLVLPYSGFSWGDTASTDPNAKQSYTVYRVTEDLNKDESYYTFTQKSIDRSNPVGSVSNVDIRRLKDSVSVLGVNHTPHLRIRLNENFKNDLVNAAAASADNAAFVSAIKGLYIESTDTTTGKALLYMLLNGSSDYTRASVQFFYHEGSNTTDVKTAFFNFVANTTAHYNKITRNYNPAVQKHLANVAVSDSVVLLQNLPGTAIDLRFPYLKNLPQALINKAELIVTKISLADDPDASNNKFFEPARIYPTGINATGSQYVILDRYPIEEDGPIAFIDGTKKSVTLANGITVTQYIMNIPREIQRAIINKTDELHLRINGAQTFYGAYRLTAGGGSHSMYRISLKLTYSKL